MVDASAERLPFADGSVDTVVSTFVLCTVDAPDLALREIARVLRPDGQLLFIEHVRSESPTLARWQDLLAGPWRRFARGCRCNRATGELIAACGLEARPRRRAVMARNAADRATTHHRPGTEARTLRWLELAPSSRRRTWPANAGRSVHRWRASGSGSSRHRSSALRRAREQLQAMLACVSRRRHRPPLRRRSRELLRRGRLGRAHHRDLPARRSGRAARIRRGSTCFRCATRFRSRGNSPRSRSSPPAASRSASGSAVRTATRSRSAAWTPRPADAEWTNASTSCAGWPTARPSTSTGSSSRSRRARFRPRRPLGYRLSSVDDQTRPSGARARLGDGWLGIWVSPRRYASVCEQITREAADGRTRRERVRARAQRLVRLCRHP